MSDYTNIIYEKKYCYNRQFGMVESFGSTPEILSQSKLNLFNRDIHL